MTGGGRHPCQEACNHDVRRMASTVFGRSMHQEGERWYIDVRCELEGTGRQRRRTQKASVDGVKMVDVRGRAQEAGVDGVKMVDVRGRAQEASVDGVKMVDVRGGHIGRC